MPSWLAASIEALARSGIDVRALALAWMRVVPSIVIVPAFGLRALPPPARAIMGLAFAASIVPAVGPATDAGSLPWALRAFAEGARGLPIALAASVPLWAATMAGGVADALRGAQEAIAAPTVEGGRATAVGVPLSLLASSIFLWSGGPAHVALALARPPSDDSFARAAHDLTAGISLAVALGAPLLAASVVLELAAALVARAASPAQVHALLAPLRALGSLAVTAIVLDRVVGVLARAIARSLP